MNTAREYGVRVVSILVFLLITNFIFADILNNNPQYEDGCKPYREGWQVNIGE